MGTFTDDSRQAMPSKKKVANTTAPMVAQGTGTKRTPTSAFDGAAGKERVFSLAERVFSAAGKMHGDLSKSAKDTTLEHSLFAAFNTD